MLQARLLDFEYSFGSISASHGLPRILSRLRNTQFLAREFELRDDTLRALQQEMDALDHHPAIAGAAAEVPTAEFPGARPSKWVGHKWSGRPATDVDRIMSASTCAFRSLDCGELPPSGMPLKERPVGEDGALATGGPRYAPPFIPPRVRPADLSHVDMSAAAGQPQDATSSWPVFPQSRCGSRPRKAMEASYHAGVIAGGMAAPMGELPPLTQNRLPEARATPTGQRRRRQ